MFCLLLCPVLYARRRKNQVTCVDRSLRWLMVFSFDRSLRWLMVFSFLYLLTNDWNFVQFLGSINLQLLRLNTVVLKVIVRSFTFKDMFRLDGEKMVGKQKAFTKAKRLMFIQRKCKNIYRVHDFIHVTKN
jgi:hypothetical protein